MGEVAAACVVLKPGASLTLPELTAWARERLANFKVPRHLFVEESLPRTPLGKVQKFLLKGAALAKLREQPVSAAHARG
jgi:acyl-CoA synthetase (AMP-forming)/AMP-acid ligase II